MEFAYLTYPEVEEAKILWDEASPKPPELVVAARKAGFTEDEVLGSPLGVLQEEFVLGEFEHFRVGSRALIGMNGCTLLEVTHH